MSQPTSDPPPLFAPKDSGSRESEIPPTWVALEPEAEEDRNYNLSDYDPLENRP
jgi:hypothetical protein